MNLPRLYPILDASTLTRANIPIPNFARDLRDAGVRFLQYRDKHATNAAFLERAAQLRTLFPAGQASLILNDRAHLFAASGFDGLHLGQDDLPTSAARAHIGPAALLGLSTHNPAQLQRAASAPADYLAIGPIFRTSSKANPDPVVGLEGIRTARALTNKPLVAIGGITLDTARSVFDAGADSVALISALLPTPERSTAKVLADFIARIG